MEEKDKTPKTSWGFDNIWRIINSFHDGSIRETFNDWKWIFSYSRHFRGRIVIYTILGLLGTTMGLISSIANKFLVDVVTGRKTDLMWLAALVTVSCALARIVIRNVRSIQSSKLHVDMANDIRSDVFNNVINADWERLSHYSNGDLVSRLHSDVDAIKENAISWIPKLITSAYSFIATFFVIWHYSKGMSMIAMAGAPVVLLVTRPLLKKQRYYRMKMLKKKSKMVSFETETLYNLDTVKSFGVTDLFGEELHSLQEDFQMQKLAWNRIKVRTNVLHALSSLLLYYIAYAYCLYLLWTNHITYGTMVLFLGQRQNLSSSMSDMATFIPSFLDGAVSARRLREISSLKPEEKTEEEIPEAFFDGGLTVKVKQADFAYLQDEEEEELSEADMFKKREVIDRYGQQVIHGSDFIARPGEIAVLIGPSGEGKTTVLRLLLGIIHPQSGEVCFETSDGQKVNADATSRQLISYVPQGNSLIAGTIADNLRIGKQDATREEMIDALKMACAWSFIKKLPDKLEYRVKSRGRGFSEGQAQRIAIARALLRQAPILLMDEATSALDIETECSVLEQILQKQPTRTIILTTHRPSVLSMSDLVYRVVKGEIIALNKEEKEALEGEQMQFFAEEGQKEKQNRRNHRKKSDRSREDQEGEDDFS